MTLRLPPEERARLGLSDTAPGDTEVLEIAAPAADQGRGTLTAFTTVGVIAGGAPSLVSLVADLFAQKQPTAEFASVSSRIARNANLAISLHRQNHGLVLVESPRHRLHGRGVVPDAVVHPDSDPAAVVADLNAGPAAIELSDGSRIVLQFRQGKIMLDWLPAHSDAPLPTTISPPLLRLMHDTRDPWAHGLIHAALTATDAWTQLVAAGTFCRLWEPTSADEIRDAVQRAIAGTPEPHQTELRTWGSTLSSDDKAALRRTCLTRIDGMHRLLDDLTLEMAPDDTAWIARFEQACRERDDLESVRADLAAAGVVDEVDIALEGLDARGRSLVTALPVVIRIDDERLQRAARVDPNAWWAEPALA